MSLIILLQPLGDLRFSRGQLVISLTGRWKSRRKWGVLTSLALTRQVGPTNGTSQGMTGCLFGGENNQVVGFHVGKTRVPGAFEIADTGTGIRWRYDLRKSSEAVVESTSDRMRSAMAFKSVSNLLFQI